jgi:putative peptidoglycan lipid II flippase
VTIANVVGNVLATSLLPQLLKIRHEQGPGAETAAQQRALFWSILLLTSISLTFAALGPMVIPWLSPGFAPESRRLAEELLWMATPYGVLAGMTRVYAVLAESESRFARTSLSPLLTATLSMVILVLGGARPGILVAGLTAGTAAELIFNATALRGTRYRAIPRAGRFSAFESSLVAIVWPLSLGAFLQGLTVTVDQSMATLAGPGAVSELSYGIRFIAVAIGLVAMPLLQYAFPQFAKLAAANRFEELRSQFRKFAILAAAVSLPPMIVLSGASRWIVETTFERGRFTPEMADRVALIQSLSALQLPFVIVAMLGLRAVVALKLRHVMFYQGAAMVVANLALDWLLLKQLGVPGIALATTIIQIGSCLFMLLVIERTVQQETARTISANDNRASSQAA